MKNKIAFRVDVSSKLGSGHFKRLKSLEEKLKFKKIFWFVSGEKKLIDFFFKKKRNIYKIKNEIKVLKILQKERINLIVTDISHDKNILKKKINKIHNFYKKNNIFVVSFDDPRHKIISDISIIPYDYNYKKIHIINKNCKIFIGRKYFFFSKKLIYYSNKQKELSKNVSKVLISISGTDFRNIGLEILNLIKDLAVSITIITGEKIKKKKIDIKTSKKIRYLNYTNSIEKLIFSSDVVIAGEGLIKYETSILKTPTLIIHQKDTKSKLIKKFLKHNTCKSLGLYNKKNKELLKKKIISYFKNYNLRLKNFKNAKKKFCAKDMIKGQNEIVREIKLKLIEIG
jgi:UDP-2,4-diacetamido-2,4,6-trideoxy-beta-L-altropyranose hydrolase